MERPVDIKSLNLEELISFIEELGEKKFRAKQIYQWLHVKHVSSFDEMSNISKALIEKLKENGIVPVSLGKRILRTETAGFVATSLIQYELSDLGGNK